MATSLELVNQSQIDFLNAQPIFLTYLFATQNVASVTASTPIASVPKVSWNAPQIDSYNGWSSLDPTKYTFPIAGYYLIVAQVYFNNNSTGSRIINISKNGLDGVNTIGQVTCPPNSDGFYGPVLNCAGVGFFNGTTDFIQIAVFQGTGSALGVHDSQTRLNILRIHN